VQRKKQERKGARKEREESSAGDPLLFFEIWDGGGGGVRTCDRMRVAKGGKVECEAIDGGGKGGDRPNLSPNARGKN